MSFIVRSVTFDDLGQLLDLAKQFNLLNLPGDKKVLSEKIERSVQSFTGDLPIEKAEYLFVLEDVEEGLVVGSSLILAKHGTKDVPHSYFRVLKKDHFSEALGIGFIHQVLRFQMDTDGPSEIGGLLVDKIYRRRPEKLGKQISLSRFMYMALHPDRFEERILCELTPPFTEDNRSEFWEALGRRFTGLNYNEADLLSQSNKEFIESLFPQEDIYLCLLDSKARVVMGRVGESTKPAQHLLESIGFEYLDEVDPFDGGPHYGCETKEILPIKMGRRVKVSSGREAQFTQRFLIANTSEEFKVVIAASDVRDNEIIMPSKQKELLGVEDGDEVFVSPFDYSMKKEKSV